MQIILDKSAWEFRNHIRSPVNKNISITDNPRHTTCMQLVVQDVQQAAHGIEANVGARHREESLESDVQATGGTTVSCIMGRQRALGFKC